MSGFQLRTILISVVDPDTDPGFDPYSIGSLDPGQKKKVKQCYLLKCWMFSSGGLKASPVA
jgi:hypothetical protein